MISLYRLYGLNILSLELCLFLAVSFPFCIPGEQCLVSVFGVVGYGCTRGCADVYVAPEVNCGYLSQLLSTLFFGSRVSHRTWSSQIRVGWVSSELQGSTCLYHSSAETASLYWLFTWVLEIQTHVHMLAQESFLSCLLSSHPMNHFSSLQAWCLFLSCTRSSTGLAQQCINVSALKRPFGFFKNISKSCL